MGALNDRLKGKIALKKRLRYVFASRIGGITGGFAVLDTLILFFVAMVYGTLVYQAQAVNALAAIVIPPLTKTLDSSTDQASLAQTEFLMAG